MRQRNRALQHLFDADERSASSLLGMSPAARERIQCTARLSPRSALRRHSQIDMPVREITEYPESVLAKIGQPITNFDQELADLCADMFETMYDAEGVGLAAPQVGLNLRLFVMDCEGVKLIAANPQILSTEGEQSGQEGCLSVGKVPAVVVRAQKVRLKAQDENGEWFEREAEGYAARAFLHETDHCDGKLFMDHLPKLRRDMVIKKFQKEKRRV